MSLSKKQIRNKTYYEKNKDRIIENVKARRTDKIKQEKPTETRSTPTEITTTTEITTEKTTKWTIMSPPKRIIIRIPYPDLDFLIWTKRMTYVTVDIRDTTGKFMWDGTDQTSKEKNISIQNKIIIDHSIEINKYIDGIKRFFKVGERYVIEVQSAKLNIPMFFYIKEINEENIIIDYVKIDFLKIGTGEATIAPLWDEIKEERIIGNKDIINIYPFDEQKKYRYRCYCYIRNDVREFYGIVNKR